MTRDDIIRLAREAGIPSDELYHPNLERFAALVAAAERKPLTDAEITKILHTCGSSERNGQGGWHVLPYGFTRAIEAAHGIKGEA